MPIKYFKNNQFFTSSDKLFLKDDKIFNHWFGHSVMKPVDSESLKTHTRTHTLKKEAREKMATLIKIF